MRSARNDEVNRVVVRAPNWLGDAVMCEPALRQLKRLFQRADLALLAKPAVTELFQGHPAVDRLIVYDGQGRHAGLAGKWVLAGELRRMRFDVAVLFQNAFEAALLAYLAGIPRRYGYATDGRTLFLSEPIALPDRRTPVHQVRYYWNLLRPLGLAGDPPQPELFLLPQEEQSMAARLVQTGIAPTDIVIGINPGSTYGAAKRWSPERYTEVAERLCRMQQNHGRQTAVVILGGPGEEQLGRDIAAGLSSRSAVLSGTTTVRELMAAVKRCALLLTNDTGPMHIATAFQVPTVAIFGPTDWRTTSPYGHHQAVVQHPVDCAPCLLRECPIDHRCMTGVSADQVYEASLSGLSRLSGQKDQIDRTDQVDQVDQKDRTDKIDQKQVLDGYTVFLDRDGTLNIDPGYLKSPADLKLMPDVAISLARLKAAGARLVVVTNQSGIGRGLFSHKDLEAVHARLQGLLEQADAALDAIYFCPHHPDDGCRCRKPERGMVDRAVAELQIDLGRSYLIGDHARDMQLANTVGAKAILVTTGSVDVQALETLREAQAMPAMVVSSMTEAVDWILADARRSNQPSAVSSQPSGLR